MLGKIASNQLFKSLDNLDSGQLEIITPDGQSRTFSGKRPGEKAKIELRDWSVISNMIKKGDIAFANDYRAGLWESDDLTALTTLGLMNKKAMNQMISGSQMYAMFSKLSYLLRMNTLQGSKKNIQEHYDLGNDFYELWLDPTMTYSSAIYHNGDDLKTAQDRKYDRILDCINDTSGSVLEVGCGWGGFADRAMQRGDYGIKGITLSEEQHDYANQRLNGNANIVLEDYRHQTGKFDNIVSIEMFEAVGEKFWPTYFSKLKELLSHNGKAVIQTITMNEDDFPTYRKSGDFIRSFIFPGGMLPSPSRFNQEAEKAGLKVGGHYKFGMDYSKTLDEWLVTFDDKINDIRALGYDDSFIRLWRLYLAACSAGFKSGHTDVMQVELSHA